MKNLILKDLKLSVHPTTAIYAAVAGGLMFVPAYPRSRTFDRDFADRTEIS